MSGRFIRRVGFLLDGRSIGTVRSGPFALLVHSLGGVHRLRAHVTFTDGTPARNLGFAFRACTQQVRRAPGAPGFTG